MSKEKQDKPMDGTGTRPRGFASPESDLKVKEARAMVAERFPAMSNSKGGIGDDDVTRYLVEVGAGRLLALYNFAGKPEPEAKKSVKKSPKRKAGK